MSCGPSCSGASRSLPQGRLNVLADEGFRLFFALGAVYAALWPLMWVMALGFDLPLAHIVPPSIWHAHEMLVGAFGAALLGFLTTAAPEWTDTEPLRGRPLWVLAALWGLGRSVGLLGWDGMGAVGALADLGWLMLLLGYILRLSWQRQTDRLLAFAFWLCLFTACTATARYAFVTGNIDLALRAAHLIGFAFLGLLGLALARITVPVTNLVLDPSEATSPFRPHPGRLNLAPGLVFVAIMGEVLGASTAVSGFLLFGAGAAFMDRVAESFIGRNILRAEVLLLSGASALAGTGLMLAGAARLSAFWPEVAGLHVAFMGGLGLGVYAVFCIAGLMHSGRPLGLDLSARLGACCLVLSVGLRVAPDFGLDLPGPLHSLASATWTLAFLLWLKAFWPALSTITLPQNDVILDQSMPDNGDLQTAAE